MISIMRTIYIFGFMSAWLLACGITGELDRSTQDGPGDSVGDISISESDSESASEVEYTSSSDEFGEIDGIADDDTSDSLADGTETELIESKKIIYVSKHNPINFSVQTGETWDFAFHQLTDALSAANDGDEIWISAGTYYPDKKNGQSQSLGKSASFVINKNVTIYGGFRGWLPIKQTLNNRDLEAYPVILSCDIDEDDNTDPETGTYDPETGRYIPDSDNCAHVMTVESAGQLVLDGVSIVGGYADGFSGASGGGAVFMMGGDVLLRHTKIEFNHAKNGGGVSWSLGSGSLEFDDVELRNNSATVSGGGIFSEMPFTMRDSIVEQNYSGGIISNNGGGGIYIGGDVAAIFNDTVFRDNISSNVGGAIRSFNASLELNRSIFTDNVSVQGGAIAIFGESKIATIDSCTFKRNAASLLGGGAVFVLGARLNLSNSLLQNNTAHGVSSNGSGGALYAIGTTSATLTLSQNQFLANMAFSFGGGARIKGYTLSSSQNNFSGNTGSSGGGLYLKDSDFTMTDDQFTGNSASYQGGGLHLEGSSNGQPNRMRGVLVSHNLAAQRGGGVSMVERDVEMVSGVFAFNQSLNQGAGVWTQQANLHGVNMLWNGNNSLLRGGAVMGTEASGIILTNSVLINNRATRGAAITTVDSSMAIQFCTVVNNDGSEDVGGIWAVGTDISQSGTIRNSILWSNGQGGASTSDNLQLDSQLASFFTIDYSVIDDDDITDTVVYPGLNNLEAVQKEQLFVNLEGSDGTLGTLDDDVSIVAGSGSPAHNTGNIQGLLYITYDYLDVNEDGLNDSSMQVLPWDFKEQTRVVGIIDRGAVEVQE